MEIISTTVASESEPCCNDHTPPPFRSIIVLFEVALRSVIVVLEVDLHEAQTLGDAVVIGYVVGGAISREGQLEVFGGQEQALFVLVVWTMEILRKRSRRRLGIIDDMPMIGRSWRVVIVDLDGILFYTRNIYHIHFF